MKLRDHWWYHLADGQVTGVRRTGAQMEQMEQRTLGGQGLYVSTMGLGCMGMNFEYGPADDGESIATIQRAIDLGVTLFDTADVYGPHSNEELIGRAIGGRRDEVILASKFGHEIDENGAMTGVVNGRPEYVARAIDASLRRLGVDHVDLYYQHRVDPTVPIEDTWGALAEVVEAGKVRYVGISEAAPATIRRAHNTFPITAIQTEYSLLSRDVEQNGVLEVSRELGIGFVAYSPLGRGLLSRTVRTLTDLAEDDFRRFSPRFQAENFEINTAIVDRLGQISERKGVSVAQLALGWLLAQREDIVPIPGTTHVVNLEHNLAATLVLLSPEDLAEIEQVSPPGASAGQRYPAPFLAQVYQ